MNLYPSNLTACASILTVVEGGGGGGRGCHYCRSGGRKEGRKEGNEKTAMEMSAEVI